MRFHKFSNRWHFSLGVLGPIKNLCAKFQSHHRPTSTKNSTAKKLVYNFHWLLFQYSTKITGNPRVLVMILSTMTSIVAFLLFILLDVVQLTNTTVTVSYDLFIRIIRLIYIFFYKQLQFFRVRHWVAKDFSKSRSKAACGFWSQKCFANSNILDFFLVYV